MYIIFISSLATPRTPFTLRNSFKALNVNIANKRHLRSSHRNIYTDYTDRYKQTIRALDNDSQFYLGLFPELLAPFIMSSNPNIQLGLVGFFVSTELTSRIFAYPALHLSDLGCGL